MVAPTVVGVSNAEETSGSTKFLTIAIPAGVVDGDYLVAFLRSQNADPLDWSLSGWERIGPVYPGESSAGRLSGMFAHKVTDVGVEPTSYAFEKRIAGGRMVGSIVALRGIDFDNPIAGANTSYVGAEPSGTSRTVTSYTIVDPSYLLVMGAGEFTSGNVHGPSVPPAGYTELASFQTGTGTTGSRTGVWGGGRYLTGATVSGDAVVEWAAVSGPVAQGVALRPGVYDPDPVEPSEAPEVVGTATVVSSQDTGTSITVPRPEGVQAGDFLVCAIRGQSGSQPFDYTSDGWERLGVAADLPSGTSRVIGFYGMPVLRTSTLRPEYVFTAGTGYPGRQVAAMFTVRGVDLDDPVLSFGPSYIASNVTNGRRVPSYPLTADALALFLGAGEFTDEQDSEPDMTPAGYEVIASAVTSDNLVLSRTGLWVGARQYDDATETIDADITWPLSAGSRAALSVALRGGTFTPPAEEGLPVHNGAGNGMRLFYVSPSGPATPSSLAQILPGFDSVTQMLATPGFTVAHRGGSIQWPEMSMHAYTQSMVRGYGALELSVNRSLDGVWVGCHDESINRTSIVNILPDIDDMTWAQISAYQIQLGASGAPQPYLRLEEYLETYAPHVVTFIDPKGSWQYRGDLLDILDQHGGPERFVGKSYGMSTDFSDVAQPRGYKMWGYFYPAEIPSIAERVDKFDILGMEASSTVQQWADTIAFGKPVMGHICSTVNQYNYSIAQGAVGAMVSATHLVAGVGPAWGSGEGH